MSSASTAVFLFIDAPNMVLHEGGHARFGWFGANAWAFGRNYPAMAGAVAAGRLFFSISGKLLGSFSACSSFSRTEFTPQPTWETHG
jgi:hypothetical protein